ncbi:cystathionine beta-lyase [Salmonella enterica subsp. enterica]|nr:cystathionine beta-lyase [Salmonella enterica subsp. enterica]
MTDKQLDTKLVNAGRSKKYTLGSVNSGDSTRFFTGV